MKVTHITTSLLKALNELGITVEDLVFREGKINGMDPGLHALATYSYKDRVSSISFDDGNVNVADDLIVKANSFEPNDPIQFTTTTTLPVPLVAGTTYYAVQATPAAFRVSATRGGAPIDITSAIAGGLYTAEANRSGDIIMDQLVPLPQGAVITNVMVLSTEEDDSGSSSSSSSSSEGSSSSSSVLPDPTISFHALNDFDLVGQNLQSDIDAAGMVQGKPNGKVHNNLVVTADSEILMKVENELLEFGDYTLIASYVLVEGATTPGGSIHNDYNYRSIAADYTVLPGDEIIEVDLSGGNVTVELPLIAAVGKRAITVTIVEPGNTLTFIPAAGSGETVRGLTGFQSSEDNGSFTWYNDQVNNWQLRDWVSDNEDVPGYIDESRLNWVGVTEVSVGTTAVVSALRDDSNTQMIRWTGTLSADPTTGTGAGGIDTGVETADTWYAVFIIGDTTGVNAAAAMVSISATAPTLPAGYDIQRRVGWVRNDGDSDFLEFEMHGRNFPVYHWLTEFSSRQVVSNGNAAAPTSVDLSNFMPVTSLQAQIVFQEQGNRALHLLKTTGGAILFTLEEVDQAMDVTMPTTSAQLIAYDHEAGGNRQADIWISGFIDQR